jgi:hypothetical protein
MNAAGPLSGASMIQAATSPTLWTGLGSLGGGQQAPQAPAQSEAPSFGGSWGNNVGYQQSVDPNAPGNWGSGNLGR